MILRDILREEDRLERERLSQQQKENKKVKGRRVKGTRKQKVQAFLESVKEDGRIPIPPSQPKKKANSWRAKPTLQDFVLFKKRDGKSGIKVGALPWEVRKADRKLAWKRMRQDQRRTWDALWRGNTIGYAVPDYIPSEYVGMYRQSLEDRFYRMKRNKNFGIPERTLDALDKKFA